jgi:carboxylesterase type B
MRVISAGTATMAAAIAAVAAAEPPLPSARTPCGSITGTWDPAFPGLAAFLGVPFAEPPVDSLRWRPPVPASCWPANTTFQADQQPPACVQFRPQARVVESESCLFLNVFTAHPVVATPPAEADLLPVLVWVFGGGSVVGSVQSYGEIQSVVNNMGGKVVLFAVNYRLGSFGYLALKELSATDPRGTSGNYGVLDVQEALRWVQQSATAFGGDPKRVTVFGQSSGGTQVLALLASPASNGLFHAAMSLSGSPNISQSLGPVEAQGRELVDAVGCSGQHVLKCMYAKETAELQTATPSHWSYEGDFDADTLSPTTALYPGLVIVDGVTVTLPLEEALANAVVDVPTIFASVQAENSCDVEKMAWTGADDFSSFCTTQFSRWDSSVSPAVEAVYRSAAIANASFAFAELSSDTCVTCGNAKLAVTAGQAFQSPVYHAVNVHWPSHAFDGNAFPFHTWDTHCAFETWRDHHFAPEPSDRAYGAALRSMWLALASDGQLPREWAPVTAAPGFPAHYSTLLLNQTITTAVDFKTAACGRLAALGLDQRYWWVN